MSKDDFISKQPLNEELVSLFSLREVIKLAITKNLQNVTKKLTSKQLNDKKGAYITTKTADKW